MDHKINSERFVKDFLAEYVERGFGTLAKRKSYYLGETIWTLQRMNTQLQKGMKKRRWILY